MEEKQIKAASVKKEPSEQGADLKDNRSPVSAAHRLRGTILLLLASVIWGSAFTAQEIGLQFVGPLTFTFARNVLAVAALSPLIALGMGQKGLEVVDDRMLWKGGITLGILLTVAMNIQQIGLLYTTSGKAGFITAFYIVLIPIVLFFLGKKVDKMIWIAAALSLAGLYFLSVTDSFSVGKGELLVFACSIVYTFHILVIARISPFVNTLKLSAIQFGICAILSAVLMLIFETPDFSSVLAAWQPLIFTGVFSSAIAYTLQIAGQRHLPAPVASLILSLEACFAALAAWILLGQTMTAREMLGSALMFTGVLLSQRQPKKQTESSP